MKPRQAWLSVIHDKAEQIAAATTGFTYTDVGSGESDSISFRLCDVKGDWMGPWFPEKGSDISVVINWLDEETKTFDCGEFIMDDISFSGWPLNVDLRAVSVPIDDDFKSLPRSNTWEETSVQEIASEIAGRAGVSLVYEADDVVIDEMEQSQQTDSEFLYHCVRSMILP